MDVQFVVPSRKLWWTGKRSTYWMFTSHASSIVSLTWRISNPTESYEWPWGRSEELNPSTGRIPRGWRIYSGKLAAFSGRIGNKFNFGTGKIYVWLRCHKPMEYAWKKESMHYFYLKRRFVNWKIHGFVDWKRVTDSQCRIILL